MEHDPEDLAVRPPRWPRIDDPGDRHSRTSYRPHPDQETGPPRHAWQLRDVDLDGQRRARPGLELGAGARCMLWRDGSASADPIGFLGRDHQWRCAELERAARREIPVAPRP